MSRANHLKIVPYNPNDYSLGEYLVKDHGTISEDEQFIGGALSLYFQWPEQSFCHLSKTLKDESPTECVIDFDRDERFPTELYIKYSSELKFTEFESVFIRFEVFRTCYEFEVSILAINEEAAEKVLICGVPKKIQVYKNRRFPRVYLKEDQKLDVIWSNKNLDVKLSLPVLEIGMHSIATKFSLGLKIGEEGTLKIGPIEVDAEIFRTTDNKVIFELKPNGNDKTCILFNTYSKYAYPSVHTRSQNDFLELKELYHEGGYLTRFNEKTDFSRVYMNWELIDTKHKNNNFVACVRQNGKLVGTAAASRAFKTQKIDYWCFHQLCILKNSENYDLSRTLYGVRSEYVHTLAKNSRVLIWYRSNSRWHERIYTKFSASDKNKSKLSNVKVLISETKNSGHNIESDERIFYDDDILFGGVNPIYLNLSGLLNGAIITNPNSTLDEIQNSIKNSLASCLKSEKINITIPSESIAFTSSTLPTQPSDRLIEIHSAALLNFIASMEHSIEITKRKSGGD